MKPIDLFLAGHLGFLPVAINAQTLFLCPGHLFTNQIDAAQANRQGCTKAPVGRISAVAQVEDTAASQEVKPPPSTATQAQQDKSPARSASMASRDAQARLILQTELAKTQAQMQSLTGLAASDAKARTELERLRADEAAIRRELARRPDQ